MTNATLHRVPTAKQETCPRCGGTNLFTIECPVGPHHSRTVCSDCQRHIRFNPAPWTMERARAFAMPFGKHRGRTLGDLADCEAGRGYLRWLAENVTGNAAKAAAVVLGLAPEERCQ